MMDSKTTLQEAETELRKDLKSAPEFRIMDRGRTTGGTRSTGRLWQEKPDGGCNNPISWSDPVNKVLIGPNMLVMSPKNG